MSAVIRISDIRKCYLLGGQEINALDGVLTLQVPEVMC